MKKILLIFITTLFFTNLSYADSCKKYNNILQSKKYKECINQGGGSEQNGAGIKDSAKKFLGKLNTDSKLTDYIKKKIGK